MSAEYFVYILKSRSNGMIYTGFTTDLKKRLAQHNGDLGGYTKNRGPWDVIWYCVFPEKEMAEDFERYLKRGSGYAFANKRLIKRA